MLNFPIFLSVIYVIRNQEHRIEDIVKKASVELASLVADYELIIIENASFDNTINILKDLSKLPNIPNLQVYALTKEVDDDIASWAGLENALGDYVAVFNPLLDDIRILPKLLDQGVSGVDVVFANNIQKPRQSLYYRVGYAVFNFLYKLFNGINLAQDSPNCRLLNRRVINFILQHSQPALAYRYLTATSGFSRVKIDYSAEPLVTGAKKFRESIDRGVRLLVSTTQVPMRLVTMLCIFGASANLLYSVYVVAVGIFKSNVAPGWVSISLQQSGMFFLISLVLLVLGEYMLHMASLSNEAPLYHVSQEFTSSNMTRDERLNIEETSNPKINLP